MHVFQSLNNCGIVTAFNQACGQFHSGIEFQFQFQSDHSLLIFFSSSVDKVYLQRLPIKGTFRRMLIGMFFKLKEGHRTRGHKAALVTEQCRLDTRKYSFSQRVVNKWNKLPNDCVNASSVNMFKNRSDRYLIRVGYT